MNGAEYIVEFLCQKKVQKVYTVIGGACTFIIDAISRNSDLDYVCVHHEQAAAFAADAVWRVDRSKIGVTLCTSGPGATNLITGICCSYFDSIPTLHISGQVNMLDQVGNLSKAPRQIGFQETNIVDVVRPITKYAVRVDTVEQLKNELAKGYKIATSGRMGPVLIDVPMNVQKDYAGERIELAVENETDDVSVDQDYLISLQKELNQLLNLSHRPLVLFGAGIGLAGVEDEVIEWLEKHSIPFVSSWNGQAYFDHDSESYFGNIGVYGNRGANYILQNCDLLLVMGNRLDTRQRTPGRDMFAAGATVFVIDIDQAELDKFGKSNYVSKLLDLRWIPKVLEALDYQRSNVEWNDYLFEMKHRYFNKDLNELTIERDIISPTEVIRTINGLIEPDSIVIFGIGAVTCWGYQSFHATSHTVFSNGGMAPMGYALPAGLGAIMTSPDRPVLLIEGDGGFQMNIQELQTIKHYDLNLKIVIMNNDGYGIIKQFQDLWFDSRYEASGRGVSMPDFEPIVRGYGIDYHLVHSVSDIHRAMFSTPGPAVIDVHLDPNTLIKPKAEMGNPINDQFPYVTDREFKKANRFVPYKRKHKTGMSN